MIPEWNFHKNKNFIQSENQKDLCGNEMSFQYHVNKYRETYGDGMNWFQNERHYGIMWIAS